MALFIRECLNKNQNAALKAMNYDPGLFLADIATVPFHVAHIFDDPEDVCWAWGKLLSDALDVHAPVQFSSLFF